MKSEHRHELQKNELAVRLVGAVEWCKRNAPLLLGVVVGAGLIIGGVVYFQSRSESSTIAEWSEFFSAAARQDTVKLESISVIDSGDLTGQLANLMLADTALANGIELMSTDRTAAEEQLNGAKNKYSKVRKSAANTLIKQRAALGLARYYETVGLLEESLKEYRDLVTEFPDGLFTVMAQRKIEYLQEPSTQAFAQWYRQHKPLPPADPMGTAGMPGLGDLDKLPSDEKSFPAP